VQHAAPPGSEFVAPAGGWRILGDCAALAFRAARPGASSRRT